MREEVIFPGELCSQRSISDTSQARTVSWGEPRGLVTGLQSRAPSGWCLSKGNALAYHAHAETRLESGVARRRVTQRTPWGIASANAKPAPGSLAPAPPPTNHSPAPPPQRHPLLPGTSQADPTCPPRARDENAPLRAPSLPLRVTWVGRWGSALSTQVAATGFFSLLS